MREYARQRRGGDGGRARTAARSPSRSPTRTAGASPTGGAPIVTVKYRVYAREMSVRTNWVEADFALLNGAPTFITLADRAPRPHEVVIEPARGWKPSMTALPRCRAASHRYRAPDFDTLVDSPIVIGNPAVYEFTVDGKKHYLVNVGEARRLRRRPRREGSRGDRPRAPAHVGVRCRTTGTCSST